MLVLKFKHRGYNKREVEIEGANFRGIYYLMKIMIKIFICIYWKQKKMKH